MKIHTLLAYALCVVCAAIGAEFDANSARITNPYLPLHVGKRLTYSGIGSHEGDTSTYLVTGKERFQGIECLKVKVTVPGDTTAYYWAAQDVDGNVWALRYKQGSEVKDNFMLMPANAQPGLVYELFDPMTLVSNSETITVPAGTFQNVRHFYADFGDEEEDDHYAPGVGLVRINYTGGEDGGFELRSVSGDDTTAPRVRITSPRANQRLLTETVLVKGTATDAVGAESVEVFVNEISRGQAVVTGSNWELEVPLEAGQNTIGVRAMDIFENTSSLTTVRVMRVVTSPLALTTDEGGRVTGASNGQLLEIGKNYTLRATADRNYLFAGWEGTVSGSGPSITFPMTFETQVHARFVANPFVAGTYSGLFLAWSEDLAVSSENSGYFRLTLSKDGVGSGKFIMEGKTVSFSRVRFNPLTQRATFNIERRGRPALTVQLDIRTDETAKYVEGSVSNNTWASIIEAGLPAATTTELNGQHTFQVPTGPVEPGTPAGHGSGTISIKRGSAAASGYLGDGTKISFTTPVVRRPYQSEVNFDGYIPFYVSLQRGRGVLVGWAAMENTPVGTPFNGGGFLYWTKAPAANAAERRVYPEGFTVQKNLDIARYTAPASNASVLGWTDGVLVLRDGNVNPPIENDVMVERSQVIVFENSSDVRISVGRTTGVVTGSFRREGETARTSLKGVIIQYPAEQGGSYIVGHFLGDTESGSLIIEAVEGAPGE